MCCTEKHNSHLQWRWLFYFLRVRADGLEPSTSGLRVRCSTIELRPRLGNKRLRFSVSPGRLERPTYGFEARRSIQLSYGPWMGGVDSGPAPGLSSPMRDRCW